MAPKVSIIVPVYNAQEFLRRCVDSILGQEFRDFELLLVDDGSRDESGEICDEYAVRDERVRVIHKENTGVSDTRNLAIREAKGKYLQFVDSDDWLTLDATRLLVHQAEEYQCDMVISDFYRVVGERLSHKGDIDEGGVLTREEYAAHMMENPADFYYGVLWNKLFRRDIIEKHQLCMNPDISWCEDFMFNLEYIRCAQSFYVLQVPIYYYVKRKGSLASQGANIIKTVKMKFMVFEYYNNFYKNVFDEEDYEKYRLQVYRFLVDAAADGAVPPSVLPGAKKLGEERTHVNAEAIAGEGILMDAYRDRKLLEHYLETVALKNDLSMTEARLILYLSLPEKVTTQKELADVVNISASSLSRALKRLSVKGLIRVEKVEKPSRGMKAETTDKAGALRLNPEKSKPETSAVRQDRKELRITLLPAAQEIQAELANAENDYDRTRFAGFSEEELVQYARLAEKIKGNIQKVLG